MGEVRGMNKVKEHDEESLRWLLESLTDNDDLEPFVAGIPEVLGSDDVRDSYGPCPADIGLILHTVQFTLYACCCTINLYG